ncbi:MAG: hypothetical protein ACJ71W_00825 [Terriglobales bacterium]
MLKRDELSDPNSCFNRAADDELVFVLLERDVASPHAIREWGLERVLLGKNHPDDAQIVEALQCAEKMAAKQDCDEVERNCFSQNKAIRATFPDPGELAKQLLGPAPYSLLVDKFQAHEAIRSFQRDTINTLADCLVREAARLERTNGFLKIEDLKREAQALRDYAETLAPPAPEANR